MLKQETNSDLPSTLRYDPTNYEKLKNENALVNAWFERGMLQNVKKDYALVGLLIACFSNDQHS